LRLAFLAGALAFAAARLLVRHPRAGQVVRVCRVTADLDQAEAFYRDGLGFRRLRTEPLHPAVAAAIGQAGTAITQLVMGLGSEEIALVHLGAPGQAYPPGSQSNDLWFQHIAIVVNDMAAAYERLMRLSPTPISTDGPQRLPPDGIIAFKFRDPDGHPLELIEFSPGQGRPIWHMTAPGPCLGIDHSALSVRSTGRSLRFYRRLGLRIVNRTFNHGPAQSRLDGLPGAQARISALRPGDAIGPGLELLAYQPPGRPMPPGPATSCLTDWVTISMLAMDCAEPVMIRDPDGHRILLIPSQRTAPACGPET